MHWRHVQLQHVGGGRRTNVKRATAEIDSEVRRVEQADRRAEDLVQRIRRLLEVDQVRNRAQQVAQQLAVARVGRGADDNLTGPDVQSQQVEVQRRQDDRGQAVGVRREDEVALTRR